MTKKIFILTSLFLSIIWALTPPVLAESARVAGASAKLKTKIQKKEKDPRVIKLEAFLKKQKSPLIGQANYFVQTADEYELQKWKLTFLVPAITGVESSFGKQLPPNSHNAFGWAGGNRHWNSWEESIDHVSRALKENYIDRGANSVFKIGPIYAESPTWAQRVAYFIKQIESTPPLTEQLDFTL
ncbi:MAG: glucosaminidase domain-containing protein [Candidatus Pacebacteria bacterium]|nr:glucosaminidase domain-containing protein [Candidatus Paceibacterota bacterium]